MKLQAAVLLALANRSMGFAPPQATQSSATALNMADFGEENTNPSFLELDTLARSLNPLIPYWDPLGLAKSGDFWGMGNEATIGWIRHAEIKHGRVAMAAFVGYCVQSNFHWGVSHTMDGAPFPATSLSPEAQWDSMPDGARWQIFAFVGFLEFWGELGLEDNHYMKGGKPGDYPDFKGSWPSLSDPLKRMKNMTPEKKEERLLMEINNGRLAMIGIFGSLAADRVPGSVPALTGLARAYDDNFMIFFKDDFNAFQTGMDVANGAAKAVTESVQ